MAREPLSSCSNKLFYTCRQTSLSFHPVISQLHLAFDLSLVICTAHDELSLIQNASNAALKKHFIVCSRVKLKFLARSDEACFSFARLFPRSLDMVLRGPFCFHQRRHIPSEWIFFLCLFLDLDDPLDIRL